MLSLIHAGTNQGVWYQRLYDYDATCSNEDCRRALLSPGKVFGKTFRAALSIGTREARDSLRGIRAFLSNNHNQAYRCLYDALRTCQ